MKRIFTVENQKREMIEIMLVKDPLEDFPEFLPPPGYQISLYRTGDFRHWIRIHRDAEPYHRVDERLFKREFGVDERLIEQRQYFICSPEGQKVGTATAWFNDDLSGHGFGRIHWVAVSPSHQGKGLAKALTTRLCRRFLELGHTRALVTTESFRQDAIWIYRKFGFVPSPRNEEEQLFWEHYERGRTRII